ncbi:MAG: sn-glycerol-3-phosphate ABC transporter ATP-binding protein UgpC, partial [Turneriella sp.]|nr:sn-glycerol-3-phosphate ABC transporter ATP-binding protein UgpC [Turneriella sp.]
MARVLFEQVWKIYPNGYVGVEDFNLDIADGEFMIFVGPSGCGKSTTMRMVAGLEQITRGTITIGDRVVNHVPPRDRDVAMVFQDYALYPHLSVRENLSLGLRLRKTPKAEIEERTAAAARVLGLEPYLDRKPRELSGGQRQRVALGRAIVRRPQVFLFDEPLSNLDPKLRTGMRVEIKRLHRQLGATMIYVTHDQLEAMTLGDRITVINQGKIQQVGRPIDVYNKPANLFTAGFIGSPPMNFFPLTVETSGDDVTVRNEVFSLTLPANHPTARALRSSFPGAPKVTAGIRAEHLKIVRSEKARPAIQAQVEVIEPA